MLKYFQREGKFPLRKQDIPRLIVEHIAQQLHFHYNVFDDYEWKGRTIERHRSHIRRFLGFRMGAIADAKTVLAWLLTHDQLLEEHNLDRLKEIVYERYKELKIEPPEQKRIERLIHSAIRTADERLYKNILERLTAETQEKLEALLNEESLLEILLFCLISKVKLVLLHWKMSYRKLLSLSVSTLCLFLQIFFQIFPASAFYGASNG